MLCSLSTQRNSTVCVRERHFRKPLTRATLSSFSSTLALFELDGAVIDLHTDGHRVAFNRSFIDLGYECVQFTPPIYNDLLQGGDGTAEGMVNTYFNCMGWPEMLATSDRVLFVKKVCQGKTEQLTKMLKKDEVPLRSQVVEVIKDALKDSAQVAFIAGTQCDNPNEVMSSVLRQLGPDVSGLAKMFMCTRAQGEMSIESMDDESSSINMNQILKDMAIREKHRSASDFVNALKDEEALRPSIDALPILVDNSLLPSNRRTVSPELLAAMTASLGVRLASSILIAASIGVMQAGCIAGMATVAIPRKMGFQGSFPGVAAKMEGYGPGCATWTRIKGVLNAKTP